MKIFFRLLAFAKPYSRYVPSYAVLAMLGRTDRIWRELGELVLKPAGLALLQAAFPGLCTKYPEYLRLKGVLSIDRNDLASLKDSEVNLEKTVIC